MPGAKFCAPIGIVLVVGLLLGALLSAQTPAPPSLSSSRFTEVMTTCFRPIRRMASATRPGSARSSSVGRPVFTAQKPQERVQTSPRIIRVAVPRLQHSPMLGHWALSQTVCRR